MKNYRKSRKALSPVVASIILIAVTVAVSIAVAAWMGSMTTGFMATEELKITNVAFDSNTATIYVRNTGSTTITISEVYINNQIISNPTIVSASLAPNGNTTITVTGDFEDGTSYQFKIVTSKGNPFVYVATPPTESSETGS